MLQFSFPGRKERQDEIRYMFWGIRLRCYLTGKGNTFIQPAAHGML